MRRARDRVDHLPRKVDRGFRKSRRWQEVAFMDEYGIPPRRIDSHGRECFCFEEMGTVRR
jgi:hypothetical protein